MAAGAIAVGLLLLWLPSWLVDQAHGELNDTDRIKAITEERRTVLAVLAAIGAAVTIWYTHQRQELDRDANRTDRYTKAVEQLGDDSKPSVQLGGVYALERVAHDSERDRKVSFDVLSAFIRQQAMTRSKTTYEPVSHEGADSPEQRNRPPVGWAGPPSEPALAAITVLARRPAGDRTYPRPDLRGIDWTGADLAVADLRGAILVRSTLGGASLAAANLRGAILVRATLGGASLAAANLRGAILVAASLHRAKLSRADLTRADLNDANLTDANLTGADLNGVNLTGVNLTGANLTFAILPEGWQPST